MKKLILFALLISTTALSARERPISIDELPVAARNLLAESFDGQEISYIIFDSECFNNEYEVMLTNGTRIEFDSKGNWETIECLKGAVPAALVPTYVIKEIKAKFPNFRGIIKQIERDGKSIEVELSNGLELEFDKKGRIVEIDN